MCQNTKGLRAWRFDRVLSSEESDEWGSFRKLPNGRIWSQRLRF